MALLLAGYETYKQKEIDTYAQAVYISEGLMIANSIKSPVAEFYLTTGKLPASNNDLNLPAAKKYAGQSILSAEVLNGTIKLTFDEKSGKENGVIKLTPDVSQPRMGIQWLCTSNSYEKISSWAPQCVFRPESWNLRLYINNEITDFLQYELWPEN